MHTICNDMKYYVWVWFSGTCQKENTSSQITITISRTRFMIYLISNKFSYEKLLDGRHFHINTHMQINYNLILTLSYCLWHSSLFSLSMNVKRRCDKLMWRTEIGRKIKCSLLLNCNYGWQQFVSSSSSDMSMHGGWQSDERESIFYVSRQNTFNI